MVANSGNATTLVRRCGTGIAMARLRISIVTPSFNQATFIGRTIESVLRQQGDFDLEYRVVDGGSTDATLDVLRRYGDRLTWTSAADRGQSDAVNQGLRVATGDVVGWLNSDDVLLPGALDRVAALFRANPRVGWVHGRCEVIDPDDRVIRRWVSAYKHWCSLHYSYARLLTENFISQMTVFWRRELMERVGYLDEDLHLAMDYDLWLRLAKAGDPAYIPQRIACFRWYPSSKSGAQFRRQFQEECAIAERHEPARRWLLRLKRLKAARAVAAYRALAWLRAVGPRPRLGGEA
jgi:glycosyltransferase involved in cell wall biosynthesis